MADAMSLLGGKDLDPTRLYAFNAFKRFIQKQYEEEQPELIKRASGPGGISSRALMEMITKGQGSRDQQLLQVLSQLFESSAGEKFSAGEAEKTRKATTAMTFAERGFRSREAGKSREFAAGEAGKSREFAAGEAEKDRKFKYDYLKDQEPTFGESAAGFGSDILGTIMKFYLGKKMGIFGKGK